MIKSFRINNFMGHAPLEVRDIPAINLIIGKNDAGKTSLLKLLYAVSKTFEIYNKKKVGLPEVSFRKELAEKLQNTFMLDNNHLGHLVQKGAKESLSVEIQVGFGKGSHQYKEKIYFSFGSKAESVISDCTKVEPTKNTIKNALFIPAKELLTAFSDIRYLRENEFRRGFDDTYLDLIRSLETETTKGRVNDELSTVNKTLEDLFEGKIEQTRKPEQPFVFNKGKQKFSMHQTAEGIKKIGILTTLINNRALNKDTVLFMDEPETALHPNAIRKLVEMLVAMSQCGVQIFLASHSYFIIKQLSITAQREGTDVHCWSLEKEIGEPITCSVSNLKDGILPNNSIVAESLAMYEEDIKVKLGL